MKESYIIRDQEKTHFITAAVVDWVDVCPPSRETLRCGVGWIKAEGYDIYDLGDNPGQFINSYDRQNLPDASAFYDMEKLELFS